MPQDIKCSTVVAEKMTELKSVFHSYKEIILCSN